MLCLEKMGLLRISLVCVGVWASLVQVTISVTNMTGCGNNGEFRQKQPFEEVFKNFVLKYLAIFTGKNFFLQKTSNGCFCIAKRFIINYKVIPHITQKC